MGTGFEDPSERAGTSTGSSNHCARSSESINATFKSQLDLGRHGGKTPDGVCARIAQRVLALTAAIWHNGNLGSPSGDH